MESETGIGTTTAASSRSSVLTVRRLGLRPYEPVWERMREFTESRARSAADELWLLEHTPVYTLGQAGRREHLLDPGSVPVVQTDRGGQVTYHGPGQLVAYVLLDMRRAGLGVRRLVHGLEQCIVDMLAERGVRGERRARAPGVYVAGRKLCALGLRVRNGCCYHGLALNVDGDLEPFERIDPCGFPDLRVTRLADLAIPWSVQETGERLARAFARLFAYRRLLNDPQTASGEPA